MHQLQQSGSFSDIGKLKSLMDMAHQDIVLSAGWGEQQFKRMAALAGGDVEFRTLPVVRYENINGQDVNIIDPAAIRAEIAAASGTAHGRDHDGGDIQPPPARTRSSTSSTPAVPRDWRPRCRAISPGTGSPPGMFVIRWPASRRTRQSHTGQAPLPTRTPWRRC